MKAFNIETTSIYKIKPETLFIPNGTIRVHFHNISEEKRKYRMDQFKKATVNLIKAQIRADRERERKAREAQEKQQE